MRGFYFILACAMGVLVAPLLPESNRLYAGELASLRERLQQLYEILDRYEEGQSACFSSDCQKKKRILLHDLHRQMNRFPFIEGRDQSLRRTALVSGHRLVDKAFQPPHTSKPRSFSEWRYWWQQRYQHDLRLRSSWAAWRSDVRLMRRSIQAYLDLWSLPRSRRENAEALWSQGVGSAAVWITEGLHLRSQAESETDAYRKQKLEEAASQKARLAQEVEQNLRIGIRASLREIFYNTDEELLIVVATQVASMMEPLGFESLFDEELREYVNYLAQELRNLFGQAQAFDDLEYGVLGLNNFDSSTNRARQIHTELKIQRKLDQVEEWFRFGYDSSIYILLSVATFKLAGPEYLLRFGAGGASTYAYLNLEMRPSDLVLRPSSRTRELEAHLDPIILELARRKDLLELAQTQALERISEIEDRIRYLEGNES